MKTIKGLVQSILKHEKAYPFYAAQLAALTFLAGLAFIGILGFGNDTILFGDLDAQYIPFIKMFLRAITGKEDYWYSLSTYLGSGTALTYAYYCINPFNLIYLVESVPVSILTTILITSKIALGAGTFQYFESKALNLKTPSSILFSLCYTLGGFTAAMYTNIIWLDAIYMLPILTYLTMIASGGIKKDGNSIIKQFPLISLTLSFAYLFVTNFYMGFIEGVFLALVFVLSFFREKKKDGIKQFLCRGSLYAASVFLAAALCAAVLLPAAFFLYSHQAVDNEDFETLFATIPDIINSFFVGSFPALDNNIPYLYSGLPVLLLAPFFFSVKKINKNDRILTAIILVYYLICMLILPLYKFMHVFDYPNWYAYRFSFCLSFVLTAMAAVTFSHLADVSKKKYIIYTLSLIVLYSLMIPVCSSRYRSYQIGNDNTGFWVNTGFLLFYLLLFLIYKIKSDRKKICFIRIIFAVLLISEITVNLYITDQKRSGYPVSELAETQWLTEADAVNEIKADDPGLYRISVKNETTANASAWFGYAGLNTFSSSDDYNLRRVLYNLGISAPNRCIFDAGYTPVTYALMGTKYKITAYSEKDELDLAATYGSKSDDIVSDEIIQPETDIMEDHLPLVFMADNNILDYIPSSDPFINQEKLVSALSGKEYTFFTPVAREDLLEGNYNTAILENQQIILFTKKSPLSNLAYYSFNRPHDDNELFYGYFYQDQSSAQRNTMYLIGETDGWWETADLKRGDIIPAAALNAENYRYIPDADPSVSYDSVAVYTDKAEVKTDTCKGIYFYVYNKTGKLKELCEDLTATAPELISFSSADIKATVSVTDDRPVLFTTIPFDDDWHAYCDGKEIKTIPVVENAFLGARLPEGDHEIELKYIARYSKEGLIISLGAVIILVILSVLKLILFKKTK